MLIKAFPALCCRKPRLTAAQERNQLEEVRGIPVSERAVQKADIGSFLPANVPKLEERNRRILSQKHRLWKRNQWNNVLFSDECRILKSNWWEGKIVKTQRGTIQSVQFWNYGGVRWRINNGVGKDMFERSYAWWSLVTAYRYIRVILEGHLVHFTPFIGDDFFLLHDNARPHTARITRAYLNVVDIIVRDWPVRSSNMNPIKHKQTHWNEE